jgi:hypothetical protein
VGVGAVMDPQHTGSKLVGKDPAQLEELVVRGNQVEGVVEALPGVVVVVRGNQAEGVLRSILQEM